LSAVLGAVQLLRDKYNEREAESYLGIIQRSCEVVISIIDDILGHSRMKANQMALRIKSFSLPDLLTDIEASIKASQQNSGVLFLMTVDPDIPTIVEGDKLRVSQLLINLLTNAFKFTDEGRVSLTVDLVEKTTSRILVRFVIQDTGIGMSEGFLQKAFEPYAREEHAGNYRSGFGLGLAICKQIVDLMGGSIDVLSAVGQGSRFTLVLPFAIPE
jgi:signal transduction histidine kinase